MPNCDFLCKKKRLEGYKEVLIIGNGPSGLCLSYYLAGNRPYWNKKPVSDEYLQIRLESCDNRYSLVEQDLEFLSDGLMGRSRNPISLLYDQLNRPNADFGVGSIDQESCLDWKFDPTKEIDHLVIGRCANPGGAWNSVEPTQMTLSLKNWMELPGMNISEFDTGKQQQKCNQTPQSNKCKHSKHVNENNNNLFTSETFSEASQFRATAKEIKAYYEKYAERNNLAKYLFNGATVTAVKKFACCSSTSDLNELWEVCGFYENANSKRIDFKFICKYLVLATGVSDIPNELNVCGEHYNFVLKSQKELEEKIRKDVNKLRKDPLVIVGSGLNAAECILLAQQYKIKVIHVVRRSVYDQNIIFSRLSKSIYPEYHHVYEKMVRRKQYDETKVKRMNHSDEDVFVNSNDDLVNSNNEQHEYYQLFDEHEVKCFTSRRTCIIRDLKRASAAKVLNSSDGDIAHAEETLNEGETELKMSYACVLIGNLPNFGFFSPAMRANIGIKKTKPVNGKDNPVNVDPFTLESNEYKNLFAMGPLVGDNFVRFAIGGALAITNTLIKNRIA